MAYESARMESLRGQLLIASPQLQDPNFARAVVLMVEHTDQGALGVVLNRPTDKTVADLLSEVGAPDCKCQRPVHLGGPVPGPLMSVHTLPKLAEVEVIPGVFLSAKKANLDKLVRRDNGPMKVFLGHSGWGPGQLDREMDEGAWLTSPATVEAVFYHGNDLWNQVCKQLGDNLWRAMGVRDFPRDPSLN